MIELNERVIFRDSANTDCGDGASAAAATISSPVSSSSSSLSKQEDKENTSASSVDVAADSDVGAIVGSSNGGEGQAQEELDPEIKKLKEQFKGDF